MRRAFIALVALAAFLLSFARLVVKVLESGAFDDLERLLPAGVAGGLVVAAACIWALVVDSVWIAGLFGVRQNRGDWRAWAMLSVYAALTVCMQAFGVWRELAWAIPPVALVLSLVILDLDKRPREPESPPLEPGKRLGVVDERDPERTMEMFPPGATAPTASATAHLVDGAHPSAHPAPAKIVDVRRPHPTPTGKAAVRHARFWARVDLTNREGCWLWKRPDSNGYGHFEEQRADGRRTGVQRAHRWAWEALRGEIPPGFHLDHLCRNSACVNPDHLEPVTNAENARRAAAARDYEQRYGKLPPGMIFSYAGEEARAVKGSAALPALPAASPTAQGVRQQVRKIWEAEEAHTGRALVAAEVARRIGANEGTVRNALRDFRRERTPAHASAASAGRSAQRAHTADASSAGSARRPHTERTPAARPPRAKSDTADSATIVTK